MTHGHSHYSDSERVRKLKELKRYVDAPNVKRGFRNACYSGQKLPMHSFEPQFRDGK